MSSIGTLNFLEFPLDVQQEILMGLSRNNFLKFFDVLLGDRRFGSMFINSKHKLNFERIKKLSNLYRNFLLEFKNLCLLILNETSLDIWDNREFSDPKVDSFVKFLRNLKYEYSCSEDKDPSDFYKSMYQNKCGRPKYENEILVSSFDSLGLKLFRSSDIGDHMGFNLFLPTKVENNLNNFFYEVISSLLQFCFSYDDDRFDIYSCHEERRNFELELRRSYDPLTEMFKNFEFINSNIYYLETIKNIIYVFNQFDRCFPVFDQKRKRLHYFKCCPYEYPEVQKLFHLILNNPKMPENVKIEVQSVADTFKIKLLPISDEKILTSESQNFSNSTLPNSNVSQIPSFVDEYSVFLKSESNLNSLQEEIQLNYVKLLDSSNVETISKCPSEYQFEERDELDLISSKEEEDSDEEYEEDEYEEDSEEE